MSELIALHQAFERGDLEAVKAGLGNPPDFPNCRGPVAVGEIVLEYAIYHSPLAFIRTLLELGADPNYGDHAGFSSLIAALTCADRDDMYDILELLLSHGANPTARTRIDDYATPLEEAVILGLTEIAAAMRKLTGQDS